MKQYKIGIIDTDNSLKWNNTVIKGDNTKLLENNKLINKLEYTPEYKSDNTIEIDYTPIVNTNIILYIKKHKKLLESFQPNIIKDIINLNFPNIDVVILLHEDILTDIKRNRLQIQQTTQGVNIIIG